jgi:ankyrin repeat protein
VTLRKLRRFDGDQFGQIAQQVIKAKTDRSQIRTNSCVDLFVVLGICLPSSHQNERNEKLTSGLTFEHEIQERKVHRTDTMSEGSSILKEINKNTASENFKVNKKHKFGHVPKKPEPNVLTGEFETDAVVELDNQSNFNFAALFESIESNQSEKLLAILDKESGAAQVNTVNSDGFSPLDIAVLLDNHTIIKTLLEHGANVSLESNKTTEAHLNDLLLEAEQKLYQVASTSDESTSSVLESDKQKLYYDKRVKLLRKMMIGWQSLRVPDMPFSFSIGNNRAQ